MKNFIYLIIALFIVIVGCNQNKAKEYFAIASEKCVMRDSLGAIEDLTKAIELNPKFVDAYINRGNAKYTLKDYTGAIADYTKAIALKPNFTPTYVDRSAAKKSLKDYRGSIDDLTKVIELNLDRGTNAKAYYFRGLLKIEIGQKETGCSDLSKAGELGIRDAYEVIKQFCQ